MIAMIADPDAPLSVSKADKLARELSGDRVRVRSAGDTVTLYHDQQRLTIHLLPYQLTTREIERVVAENNPWPE